MERIDPEDIRRHQRQLARALSRWEAESDPAEARRLRTTAAQVRDDLDAWETAGVYADQPIQQLRDLVQHVEARLTMASQAKARGY